MYRNYLMDELRREDGSLVVVGDRIACNEHYAVVKYIGDVPPTNGLWLGVEWDELDRGKHNGIHNGVKYFQTRHERSGSFVRPQKVTTLGVTFLSSVKNRYGIKNDHDAGVITDELFVMGSGNQTTTVEMVGAKTLNLRQSKLEDLIEVDVTDNFVYGRGQDDLTCILPNLKELNLSRNLLASWKRVAEIVKQLPCLTHLFLSSNVLPIPKDLTDFTSDFSHIESLIFNKSYYTWKQILGCSKMFEKLESLAFSYNSLRELSDSTGYLNNLKFLAIENNKITSWKDILNLGHLPRLGTLALNDNKIESIEFPDVDSTGKTTLFPQLKTLYIVRNKISQWSSINELNKLSNLCDIMLLFNPINSLENTETTRQIIIAKISTLRVLNRTQIFKEERKGSEIDYLKRFGQKWRAVGGSQVETENKPNVEFIQEHPQYLRLLSKWGAPEDSELEQKSTMLKDNLVCVKLSCLQNKTKGIIEKKLPQTMTVQKVRALVQRLFKADASTLQLSYSSQKMEGPSIEMDNDFRQLSFYSIESGDIVHIKW